MYAMCLLPGVIYLCISAAIKLGLRMAMLMHICMRDSLIMCFPCCCPIFPKPLSGLSRFLACDAKGKMQQSGLTDKKPLASLSEIRDCRMEFEKGCGSRKGCSIISPYGDLWLEIPVPHKLKALAETQMFLPDTLNVLGRVLQRKLQKCLHIGRLPCCIITYLWLLLSFMQRMFAGRDAGKPTRRTKSHWLHDHKPAAALHPYRCPLLLDSPRCQFQRLQWTLSASSSRESKADAFQFWPQMLQPVSHQCSVQPLQAYHMPVMSNFWTPHDL